MNFIKKVGCRCKSYLSAINLSFLFPFWIYLTSTSGALFSMPLIYFLKMSDGFYKNNWKDFINDICIDSKF
jgi:hypothetical protein